MLRGKRSFREPSSTALGKSLERSDNETSARVAATDSCGKRGSTPSRKRWTSSDDSGRPPRDIKTKLPEEQTNTEDTVTESPDVKSNDRSCRTEEYARGKARRSDVRAKKDRLALQSRRKRRKTRSKRSESRRGGQPRTTDDDKDDGRSSAKRYSESSAKPDKSQKRMKTLSRADDEMPITEILKKTQEDARARHEKPVPLPELTSDRIYIQGRSGFSAVKIGGSGRAPRGDTAHVTKGGITDEKGYDDSAGTQLHMLIKVAITVQNFWGCAGLVHQGLLGGMALLHFVMVHVFFDASMTFALNYSVFSEVYTNTFSFLIALCVISVFDKFDLARLDVDHLREIYTYHAKTAVTIPLYLITFGLHQATAKVDDQLLLARYYGGNETTRSNNTTRDAVLENLRDWQRITTAKDLLAALAWLFVTLGTRDNMLLTHLESMDKYANNVESLS